MAYIKNTHLPITKQLMLQRTVSRQAIFLSNNFELQSTFYNETTKNPPRRRNPIAKNEQLLIQLTIIITLLLTALYYLPYP